MGGVMDGGTGWSRAARAGLMAMVLVVPAGAARSGEESPLAPPDLSSPRAMLRSFDERMSEMYGIVQGEPASTQRRAKLMRKARFLSWCLDLRELPQSIADIKGFQSAVALKEVLDRVELPAIEEIPDEERVKRDGLKHWRLPETEIGLARIESGPREGEWVFDAATVAKAGEFFELARSLPYRRDATTPGLYNLYVHLTGWMIPVAWIESLPGWAKSEYADHRIWQLISVPLLMGVMGSLVVATNRLGRRRRGEEGGTRLVGGLLQIAAPLLWMGLAVWLDDFFTTQIRLTGNVLVTTKLVLQAQVFLAAILLVLVGMRWAADLIISANRLKATGIDGQLVRLGMRIVVSLLVAWLVVVASDRLGISVMPLLAGLGVSGLAVALAAQYTVENLIAGLVLYADKPVRVGEFCQFGDLMGTVEVIGLRSTRVRSVDRKLVTIPNAEFAKLKLINFTRRDRILLKLVIGLRYETTPEQLRFVLARIRELLLAHPMVNKEPARARFVGFGAYSLDVELFAFVETNDNNTFLGVQEDVLLRVIDIVAEAGTGFAFPSQTTYLARDPGLDRERGAAAEDEVAAWRRSGTLPFPDFSPEERARLADRLAFPPPGSQVSAPAMTTPADGHAGEDSGRRVRLDAGGAAAAPHPSTRVSSGPRSG